MQHEEVIMMREDVESTVITTTWSILNLYSDSKSEARVRIALVRRSPHLLNLSYQIITAGEELD
jgi:hypothetical protein